MKLRQILEEARDYQFLWIWRFFVGWTSEHPYRSPATVEIEVGFYDKDRENLIWKLEFTTIKRRQRDKLPEERLSR